jgi:RimJ/RimL family protein N-acetyltransferase
MIRIAPPLDTERLVLREYRRDDFDAFAAHLADPISAAHLGVSDREAAWRYFTSHTGMWRIDGAGWWAVELRGSGQQVGSVGAFFRESTHSIEIGWNTYREFWGHGYAREAAQAALAWAFGTRGEPRAHAVIAPANASSIQVATKLGMAFEGETVSQGKTVGVYVIHRPDADAMGAGQSRGSR